jgi:protein-serine/threonine kinase
MPPTAPPRTSSNYQNARTGEASRRTTPTHDRSSDLPRHAKPSDARTSRTATEEDVPVSGEDSRTSSGRRRHHQHAPQEAPSRTSSNREGRAASVPTESSRRDSTHVQQHERPDAIGAGYGDGDGHDDDDNAAPPPIIGMGDPADPSRRRSRHDHRANRRDRDTKFNDYILGNVIGEGEFGKVRLGWKQDDRVQVCPLFTITDRQARVSGLSPGILPEDAF